MKGKGEDQETQVLVVSFDYMYFKDGNRKERKEDEDGDDEQTNLVDGGGGPYVEINGRVAPLAPLLFDPPQSHII